MVRQDKITYLISSFQNGIASPYSLNSMPEIKNHPMKSVYEKKILDDSCTIFHASKKSNRVLLRVGVISTSDIDETEKLMTEYIPYNRHKLIYDHLENLAENICTAFEPYCSNCILIEICDYNNKKNIWL